VGHDQPGRSHDAHLVDAGRVDKKPQIVDSGKDTSEAFVQIMAELDVPGVRQERFRKTEKERSRP
jgi:hypothetical protein